MPTKRTVKPLSAKDSNKTALGNSNFIPKTVNEQVLYIVCKHIEGVVGPSGSFMEPLKPGEDYWTEAYEQSHQLRMMFDSLRQLVADLLHRGVCVAIAQCGKVMVVPDFADIRNKCGDANCGPCNDLKFGQAFVEIVGTGRATIGLIHDSEVNFSRFRSSGTPKPFYYQHESK